MSNDALLFSVLTAIRNSKPLTPTIRELMTATGITSSSQVRYYLLKLETLGWIKRVPRAARGIILTQK
jgi:SOS-response transcriptional repressor LexA